MEVMADGRKGKENRFAKGGDTAQHGGWKPQQPEVEELLVCVKEGNVQERSDEKL